MSKGENRCHSFVVKILLCLFSTRRPPHTEQMQRPRGLRKRAGQLLHPIQQVKRIKVGQDQPSTGAVRPKKVKQSQTRQRLFISRLSDNPHPPPLLYIPPFPLILQQSPYPWGMRFSIRRQGPLHFLPWGLQ